MKKIDYELLNKKLDTFVYGDYPVFEDDILFEERLCNIILFHKLPIDFESKTKKEIYATKTKISYNKVISLSLDFLNTINPSYALKLQELIDNDLIYFKKTSDLDELSYVNILEDEIQVALLKTLEDVLCLVHEFMHYMNSRSELANNVTSYYTECFSNLIEFMLIDYIDKYHPEYKKDAMKMKRNIFTALYESNVVTKILIEFIHNKVDGKSINTYEMFDIIKNLYNNGISIGLIDGSLTKILEDVFEDDENSFEDCYLTSIRNTTALLISCYMYDYLTDNKKQKEIFDLSDHLSELDLTQVLLYLNLEFKDVAEFDLTEGSYKKLEYSYKNNLKKLW